MYMCANDIYVILQKLEGGGWKKRQTGMNLVEGGWGYALFTSTICLSSPCCQRSAFCPCAVCDVCSVKSVSPCRTGENARMFEGRIHGPYNNTRPRLTGQCCRRCVAVVGCTMLDRSTYV